MRIAIHGRHFQPNVKHFISEMLEYLLAQNHTLIINDILLQYFKELDINLPSSVEVFSKDTGLREVDFLFSVGGDGTLLDSVTYIADKETPILGINTGRMGFLATTSTHEIIEAIHQIEAGYYEYDDRSLIHLESNKDLFEGMAFGLNEFTVTKRDSSSMIVVHTYIDGECLNSYWADGLIISTPTGSTGYSLSCGGPVILPQSNSFVITPVAPHNLTVRPLIIPDSSTISLEIEGRSKNFLVSLDSRSRVIDCSVELAISKESFIARLVKLNSNNFLNTLRNKLNWGLDNRN